MDEYNQRFSRKIYFICVGLTGAFLLACIIMKILGVSISDIDLGVCTFRQLGFYCPGCGGTRAVNYLLHGDLVNSIKYHPAVIYIAVLIFCYIISHTMNILTKGKIKSMLFHPIYLYMWLAIIVIQFIVKNALIITDHIYIIG